MEPDSLDIQQGENRVPLPRPSRPIPTPSLGKLSLQGGSVLFNLRKTDNSALEAYLNARLNSHGIEVKDVGLRYRLIFD